MLLIDMPNLCMREAFAKAGLSHKGKSSGVVYGCLQQVRWLLARFPGEVCCCWDGPRKALLRRRLYPGYKAGRDAREPSPEAMEAGPQMALLRRNILPRLGLPNQMLQEGYEADDLIARISNLIGIEYRSPKPGDGGSNPSWCANIVIASSDNDLYQLLGPRTSIYHLGKKRMYTWRDFQDEHEGLSPAFWPRVKAMAGDSSDDIPGIPGVGIKTAIKYLFDRLSPKSKVMCEIKNGLDLINRNRELVALPWPGCDPGPVQESRFNEREFQRICSEWGIRGLA